MCCKCNTILHILVKNHLKIDLNKGNVSQDFYPIAPSKFGKIFVEFGFDFAKLLVSKDFDSASGRTLQSQNLFCTWLSLKEQPETVYSFPFWLRDVVIDSAVSFAHCTEVLKNFNIVVKLKPYSN